MAFGPLCREQLAAEAVSRLGVSAEQVKRVFDGGHADSKEATFRILDFMLAHGDPNGASRIQTRMGMFQSAMATADIGPAFEAHGFSKEAAIGVSVALFKMLDLRLHAKSRLPEEKIEKLVGDS